LGERASLVDHMGRGHPQGAGVFGALLAAQAESPTLSLKNAGLNDECALEIAQFLAGSRHLIRLDLTGNSLSSTGVFHIAKALKQNYTLESLTLKHNRIGEAVETGLATLCQALHGNETLRHLDLRHACLHGAGAARAIGEMLKSNSHLSHLDLSWNPLDPAGGQVLLDYLSMNTTLFDCQLTGCGIADETLLCIAQMLHRNRKGKSADLKAGPYQAGTDCGGGERVPSAHAAVIGGIGGPLVESQFIACTGGDRAISVAGGGANEDMAPRFADSPDSKFVVSNETTNEMMMRLIKFMGCPTTNSTDAARAQEMYDYLDKAQKELVQGRNQIEGIHHHLTALSSGFRDRELRSRDSIAVGQDELLELKREMLSVRGIMSRRSEDLGLIRDQNVQLCIDHRDDQQQAHDEEVENKSKVAAIVAEKKELEKRLESLEETCQKHQVENAEMRKRAARLREGVTLLHLPGLAGPSPQ